MRMWTISPKRLQTCRQMELHFDCCGKVVGEIKRKIKRQLDRMGYDPGEVMRGDYDCL